MKTTKQMIEVMQAYVDGRGVEFRSIKDPGEWEKVDHPEPKWDWYEFDYRIKKRKLYAVYSDTHSLLYSYSQKEAAITLRDNCSDGAYLIEFEEVIND